MNRKILFAAKYGTIAALLALITLPAGAEESAAKEKIRKISFVQDDDQKNIVSKVYVLEHIKAADLAPFVRSAVIRYDEASTVGLLEDKEGNRQLLIVSTAEDMLEYVDEIVEALDREGEMNSFGTIISGSGIAYGTYQPEYRTATAMRKLIVSNQISSGVLDSKVRLDKKTGLFYFKDTPSRVVDIVEKLSWLDRPVPQAQVVLKIYEIRDSDLKDIGIDYLAWKNGPGLDIFAAGFESIRMNGAEAIFSGATQALADFAGNFAYSFGGFFTAPAFDLSFIRILQQNGRATVNSTASVTILNREGAEFAVAFSPEYQNIFKDENHQTSVGVGGEANLSAVIGDVVITNGENGVVNFSYMLESANVVERNNFGDELVESSSVAGFSSIALGREKLLTNWQKTSKVEQTIGIPYLCEIPVLKYIFGTTTSNYDTTHYFVTATVLPLAFDSEVESGLMSEFDSLVKK